MAEVRGALDCLVKGLGCGTYTPHGVYPNLPEGPGSRPGPSVFNQAFGSHIVNIGVMLSTW